MTWRAGRRHDDEPGSGLSADGVYRRIHDEVIGPGLRAEGLVGRRGKYSLPDERFHLLVGFQLGRDGLGSGFRCVTANLTAIERGRWAQYRVGTQLPKAPEFNVHYPVLGGRASEVGLVVRLGQLLPVKTDQWWEVRGSSDPVVLGGEILQALDTYGLPWLRAVASRRAG